jgi:hypothetical protein
MHCCKSEREKLEFLIKRLYLMTKERERAGADDNNNNDKELSGKEK